MIKNSITIGIDLCQNLKLYKVPDIFLSQLKSKFPKCKIYFLNCDNESIDIPYEKIKIYFGNRITPQVAEKLINLEWIHFGSVGVNRLNNINLKSNIVITNSSGMMTRSVSIHALALILNFSRGINYCSKLRLENKLSRDFFDSQYDFTTDLVGEKVAIFGRGLIGKDLYNILSFLGLKVELFGRDFFKKKKYDVLKNFNYYINILPLNDSSHKKFNQLFFENISRDSVFINVGRGETVDEKSLIEAIKHGNLRGAGIDVVDNEPICQNHPFLNLKEILVTPHIAGLHNKYWKMQNDLFIGNLERYINKIELLNQVKYQ